MFLLRLVLRSGEAAATPGSTHSWLDANGLSYTEEKRFRDFGGFAVRLEVVCGAFTRC
jgi:hypothetical protein